MMTLDQEFDELHYVETLCDVPIHPADPSYLAFFHAQVDVAINRGEERQMTAVIKLLWAKRTGIIDATAFNQAMRALSARRRALGLREPAWQPVPSSSRAAVLRLPSAQCDRVRQRPGRWRPSDRVVDARQLFYAGQRVVPLRGTTDEPPRAD